MTESAYPLSSQFTDLNPRLGNSGTPEGKALAERIRAQLPGVEWVATKFDLVGKIAEILDLEVPDILVKFWEKSEEITAALARSAARPKERIDLGLGEHTIVSTLQPKLDVSVGVGPNAVTYPIEFGLALTFTLRDTGLMLKDGHITGIYTGSCEVEGVLKLDDLELAKAPAQGTTPLLFRGVTLGG
jgi:hypothetical protein